ncbi:hypothetical protein [Marinobacter fonticola]|uniref:hypothetical protein n=1 Tax=Marinobacter fonticola TaxID=2603215 RepID=UPI0011E86F34|nr:hypothetical protein [Marinobacter fonticola]
MDRLLTFVVPLRSPAASRNWSRVLERLHETARSIEAACAESNDLGAVVVVNRDAELGDLPKCFDVIRVDLDPPTVSVFKGETPEDERKEAFCWDKGYKVASGIAFAKTLGSRFVMSVDADDLVATGLGDLARSDPDAYGWYIDKGWLLPVGSRWGVMLGDFHNWCGTYAVVRTDLLPLERDVDSMDPTIVRRIFGHHRHLIPEMIKNETPLKPVDYPGAVYSVGHSEANYGRPGLLSGMLAPKNLFTRPKHFLKYFLKLRFFGSAEKKKFFGKLA